MKDDVIVLQAGDVKKALPQIADKPFAWLYLGQDIRQRGNISRLLGKGNRYLIGDLLQEVAYKEKQPFLDFIAELGRCQKNKRHWWASNTAYKSPLTSNFFLLWCYAAVFDEVCSGKKRGNGKPFLVLVEDRWLYRHLWQRHKEKGGRFGFLSRKSIIPELLKFIARGVAVRGYFLVKAGRQLWHTKSAIGKNNGSEIYIYSWVRDRFFTKDGKFESPYFGRLPRLMSSAGHSIVYVPELFLTPALKSKCLNQDEFKFIFLDQYVTIWSLVRSSLSFFGIFSFSSSPLKILLLREIACEFSYCSFPINILQYFAFKACLKEIGQRETTIIYPFENQPWDKMLCLAAKELNKNIKLVGYQHSNVPLLLLNYFLGAGESSTMPLPHVIVTDGEYTLKLLENAGYGEVKLVNGGALRYEYLHKTGSGLTRQKKQLKTILVALPYSRNLTEEMLLAVFNAFKDLAGGQIRFIIKFHPEVPLAHLKIELPPWPAHFQKTDRPLSEISKEVDLVIYSSSTIGLEALLGGVPVVRYCPEHTIELEPLGAVAERGVRSCSEDNIKQVVLSALSERGNHLVQETAFSLNSFFSPVDEDVWRQVVRN